MPNSIYLSASIAFGLLFAVAQPAHAGYAHFWAGNPTSTTPYVAGAPYTYNSSGGANRIQRVSTGLYAMVLEGVNDSSRGGNVQVSTYGDTLNHCKVSWWFPIGADVHVQIRCFDRFGGPADQRFTALYAEVPQSWPSSGHVAHFWAERATSSLAYAPSSSYRYDSAGGTITVRSVASGRYEIIVQNTVATMFRFPAINVTAYGTDATRCSTVMKNGSDSLGRFIFEVSCRDSWGGLQPSRFSVSMVEDTTAVPGGAGGNVAALFPQNWSSSGSGGTLRLSSTPGLMYVDFPGLSAGGTVIAHAGVWPYTCRVVRWYSMAGSTGTTVMVQCRDAANAPVTTDFDLQFLSRGIVLELPFPR